MGYFGRIFRVGKSFVVGMSVTLKLFFSPRSIVTRQYVGLKKPKEGLFATLLGLTEQYDVGRELPRERFMRTGIGADAVKPVDYIPERHRGLHSLVADGCLLDKGCMRICPVDCIDIQGVRGDVEGVEKNAKGVSLVQFTVDYALCIFCGLCTEGCKPKVLTMGKEYDFSSYSQEELVLNLLTGKPLTAKDREAIRRGREEIARIEAEKKAAKKS
jgi:formate hydrogenlyase subunit 6/NADH:ubiquinone oxidoreductase subunit I